MPAEPPIDILAEFNIPRHTYELLPVAHGLINKSYLVIEDASATAQYFLQQIDHHAFNDIEGIMHNIGVVTDYFKDRPKPLGYLTTIMTNTGDNYYKSTKGEYWRLYNYVAGNTYYRAENENLAAEAGKMFGEFQNALDGIEINLIKETIPRFHDIDLRYEQFLASIAGASASRKKHAASLIDLVKEHIDYVKRIYHDTVSSCPLRVTHNDTKLSNLMFDDHDEGLCVVDYDTLMPGFLPLDFGDSVRTICSTTVEDDKNIADTYFDLTIYKAFTISFITAMRGSITAAELQMLPRTAAYMPFLMGLRMLTDYLNDDVYYTIQYKQHNYDRALNQMTLFISGIDLLDEMNNIVLEIKK